MVTQLCFSATESLPPGLAVGSLRHKGIAENLNANATTGAPVRGSVGANDGLGPLGRGMSFQAGAEGLRIGREGLKPVYDFIRNRGERPFFVWYAPMMPHTPHNPPERLLKRCRSPDRPETVARYMAMCEWFDETSPPWAEKD